MRTFIVLGLVAVLVVGTVLFSRTSLQDGTGVSTSNDSPVGSSDRQESVTQDTQVAGRELDLSNRGLTKVPENVFGMTNLHVLDLSHNVLTGALQAEIRHLGRLTSLDLSDNNFTGVPAEIGQLTKLTYLDLSNNPITGLPYELGNLKELKTLDLRGTNYAKADLAIIRTTLPATVVIEID